MVTSQARIFVTGFKVGSTDCRFGILWDGDPYLMVDWVSNEKEAQIDGIANLTIIQLMGRQPREITYRLFFDSIVAFQALDALVQETGTLRIYMKSHTVPVALSAHHPVLGKNYTDIPSVLLRRLRSIGVPVNGEVEASATFTVAS